MQRTETTVEPTCRQCGFENELACETDGAQCSQCGAPLEHEAIVTYNDNCPLCGVSYEAGRPYVFVVDADRVYRWICQDCQESPRGTFYQEFEQGQAVPKAAPPCCLCGADATLIAFTHANEDGEFLCEPCSLSEAGRQMIKEHYETEEGSVV